MVITMQPYDVTPEEYAAFYEERFPDRGKYPRISELIGSQKQALVTPPIYKEEEQAVKTPAPPLDVDYDSPGYIDFSPREHIPLQHEKEARLLGHFCNLVIRRLALCHSKVEEWKLIVEEYNNGTMAPELLKLRGERKERALRLWIDQYVKSNQDMFALLHKGKNISHKRKVTETESNVLLSILLHPNQITIGSAINMLKAQARLGYFESPTSKPTLRRWCTEWMENHLATWEQTRKGSKYVAERIVKTIHRDARLLHVGQVWVADGHTLAFDILNPHTGKAQRMTMIMVFDWASRYPVGASLAFTEDSQHIQTAFRNAFLNTSHWYLDKDAEGNTVQTRPPFAFVPEAVYLDNGKAFRAKLFHEYWERHDLELELGGVFPKLGIEAHFAESYNAKAKVIERFFRTFQEQFERFISSFRGASVANKPSTLMRNEKWAKALYKREAPTIRDTMQMIGFYIRHIYGETEHGALEGKTPWQVFSSALVPEERMLRPDKLNFMMLATERKSVRNDGIVFNKLLYWHVALMDNIGKPVIIRYDYAEARWILVYDMKDNFICQAELRRSQHPFIHIDKNNPVSHQSLKKEYTQIKKLQRLTEQHARDFVLRNQEAVDNLLEPYVRESLSAPNPTFQQGSMITAPEPEAQDRIEEMEREMVKELPELEFIKPEEQSFGSKQSDTKITGTENEQEALTADPDPEEQDDDDDESFYGMLKKVGII
jgi:putative transposase